MLLLDVTAGLCHGACAEPIFELSYTVHMIHSLAALNTVVW
jgi:hypothetical protein